MCIRDSPYPMHYYQPLWTLVGGGRARLADSERPREQVMPRGVRWIKVFATGVDPERRTVAPVSYRHLDVYKRQIGSFASSARTASAESARKISRALSGVVPT